MNSELLENEIYYNENDELCLNCGSLYTHVEEDNGFIRYDEVVALKCLHDSEDINESFLNEVGYYPVEFQDKGLEIKDEILDQVKVYDEYLSKLAADKQKQRLNNSQAIYTSRILR
ncbi:15206_t:CDS:2 [Funneliformis caledonium]|uniref:15206_t:CDS:1 n=1 Tax=Funneliformis caledonium TaxID=1117310 RepID=A0A9N9GHG3_9GLOM|nr:15206_t:CDS:2 [Funneliformis caledonium]